MFSVIYNYFFGLGEDLGLGHGHRKREHIFIKFNLFTIPILFIFLLLNYLNHKFMANVFNTITLVILFTTCRYFVRSRNLNLAVFIYSLTIVILTSLNHMLAPVYLSGNILWFPVMIFVTHILSNVRYTIIVTLIGLVLFSLADLLPILYTIPHDPIPPLNAQYINMALLHFSSLAVFYVVYQFKIEEHRIRMSLELSRDQFKASSETTASLVALVTHDLASPLTVIKGYMYAFTKQECLAGDKKLEGMGRAIQSMEELIGDVRTAIACENGKLKLELKQVHLYEVLEHLLNDIKRKADDKEIELKLMVEEKAKDIVVWGEENSIRNSILSNLLSNAIKFSHRNSVVDIRLLSHQDKLIVEIEDYGIGIEDLSEKRIFDFGQPTTKLGTEGEKGSGFGLPLAKMFMDRFDGEISVRSRFAENSGTKFVLKFRIAK